jgi:hypothetical protein
MAALMLAAACGGGAENADRASDVVVLDPATACTSLTPSPVAMAVLDYITTADPKPLRFLNAATTDSALPPAAEAVVKDKGPTFYWLPNEKNQQQIRDKLESGGEWPNMLVLVRELTDNGAGVTVVRVGGRYIGRPHDGRESPERRYTIRCQVDSVATWVMDNTGGA